jgi:hypothetical protein
MRIDHVPQDRFVVNSLVAMIATSAEEAEQTESYNTAIGCGVDEIVKLNLRRLAQQRSGIGGWEDLLETVSKPL